LVLAPFFNFHWPPPPPPPPPEPELITNMTILIKENRIVVHCRLQNHYFSMSEHLPLLIKEKIFAPENSMEALL
jgi:hypothetical protein